MERFQVVVVGGGPGGYVAAIKAAQLGLSCALVEAREVGGTCLNRGCIPAKTILHAAELISEVEKASLFGVTASKASVDWEALSARAQDVSAKLRSGVEGLLAANGVELVRGQGRIVSPGEVAVTGADGTVRTLQADDVIVAAGSRPFRPPIAGIDLPGVIDSDDVLPAVPRIERLAVIGGGVIGCEIASAYADFGSEVTIIEMEGRLLATMDREFGQSLATSLKKRGVRVETSASVQAIEQGEGCLKVLFTKQGASHEVSADAVLVATGRRCEPKALFEREQDVPAMVRDRITVDEQMRTSCEHLYAIGDIADAGPQLAHAASAQAVIAVSAIAGEPCDINLASVPSCVYTSPEIASVGLTEAEAKAQGIEVRTGKYLMAGNGKTIIGDLDRGFVKIVADAEGRVLGAQLLCGRASDIIGELAAAVGCELTVDDLARVVHPHPTFVEGVGEAVEAFGHGSIHAMPRRR